jgi:hypothetical protein
MASRPTWDEVFEEIDRELMSRILANDPEP